MSTNNLTNEGLSCMHEYYAAILLCRPSNVIEFSQIYFGSKLTPNPRISNAYHMLRHVVGNPLEFSNFCSIIFCNELSALNDPESDSIPPTSLSKLVKKALRFELDIQQHQLYSSKSIAYIETVTSDQIPSVGAVNFSDFVSYMRFAVTAISLRCWIERLYLISSEINTQTGDRLESFDIEKLKLNLDEVSCSLNFEGTMNTKGWIRVIKDNLKKNSSYTANTLFTVTLNAIVKKSCNLLPT